MSNGQCITFSDMCVDNRGSLYTSANTEEQKMIESLPDFGGVLKFINATENLTLSPQQLETLLKQRLSYLLVT